MQIIYFLFIFIITGCHCVGVDYYLGNKDLPEPVDENANVSKVKNIRDPQTNLRKNGNCSTIKNVSYNESDYETYDELSEIEDRMSKQNFVDKVTSGILSGQYIDTKSREVQIGYDTKIILRLNEKDVSKKKKLQDIFKDYVYNYEETLTTPAYPMLRDKDMSDEFDFNKIVILKNVTDDQNNEKLPIDFYNLVPAVSVNENEDNFTTYNTLESSVWYVPESSPCWELPILYGELGHSMLNTDVFLTYPGNLINVIETKEEFTQPSRPLYIPVSQTMNKWCAAGPCYGDHTLCLFSDKTNSKLCSSGYTVSTPSMIEQIGLVNTVNSMRNRIANGETEKYKHLPKAADMNQLIYDFDLQSMAEAWLHQCLPGPAACSALDGNYVTQLECTKYAKHCCIDSFKSERASKCIPQYECYVDPIIGCIHVWFWSAGKKLTTTDIECGHITPSTFYTVQLMWADTNKIGCAYGTKPDGDVRVVCNFSPGAPFYIDTKYYCGFIAHKGVMENFTEIITDQDFLSSLGISLRVVKNFDYIDPAFTSHHVNYSLRFSDIDILGKIYKKKWVRKNLNKTSNGTLGLVARLVTKHTFGEDGGSQCDMNEAIYESGEPGSRCVERGRRFHALCYDFRDPTPGYRLVAVLAPVALFSLILYDLFSGVVRQTNY